MIPLYKPHMPDLPELNHILHSGKLAYGTYSKKFENMIGDFLGLKKEYIFATNSFHMAILVVTSALNINAEEEIIASPMACLASTQPLASQGIKIVWADIDPHTGTLCPESVEKKITSKTKAIMHNHFCGYPGYIDEINTIGQKHGIPIIDDGIESFGSKYQRKIIGNCGTDVTIFSFNAVRIPNTIDGGAIIIQNPDLIKKIELIRDCGIDRSIFRDNIGEISPECDIVSKGYSATMSNINAYIGMCQMEHIGKILSAQQKHATIWETQLSEDRNIEIIGRKEICPNYWIYGILVPDKRKTILEYRNKGWYASGVHINNNIYSIFGKQEVLPGVEEFYSKFVALPCGWWIQEEQSKCKDK